MAIAGGLTARAGTVDRIGSTAGTGACGADGTDADEEARDRIRQELAAAKDEANHAVAAARAESKAAIESMTVETRGELERKGAPDAAAGPCDDRGRLLAELGGEHVIDHLVSY